MAKKQVGSVFQDGDRYRAVLQLRDAFGVPFKKQWTGDDPKVLRKNMERFRQQYVAGMPTDDMKVEKVCELAIEACEKKGRAEKTLKGYRDMLKLHVKPSVGSVKIRELSPMHVERMLDKMAASGHGSQSQILCRAFLRMAINRIALKGGYVSTNAAALADPPKAKRTTRRAITPEDLAKILDTEQRPILRALWLFLASTGLRPKEARELLWRDLYEADDGWWLKLRESKTEEGKMPVPIPNAVIEELDKLRKTSLFVFPTAEGKPYDESNLRREWIHALAKAEVPYTNLYQLRKLFATLKARKVTDAVLKRLMRHTDARTTKQYYVSALDEDLRRAMEG